jgi:hypothetical protein
MEGERARTALMSSCPSFEMENVELRYSATI